MTSTEVIISIFLLFIVILLKVLETITSKYRVVKQENRRLRMDLQTLIGRAPIGTQPCHSKQCQGRLIPLPSNNIKLCTECKKEWPWELTVGQKSTCVEGLRYDNDVHAKEELVSLGCHINPHYEVDKVNPE